MTLSPACLDFLQPRTARKQLPHDTSVPLTGIVRVLVHSCPLAGRHAASDKVGHGQVGYAMHAPCYRRSARHDLGMDWLQRICSLAPNYYRLPLLENTMPSSQPAGPSLSGRASCRGERMKKRHRSRVLRSG